MTGLVILGSIFAVIPIVGIYFLKMIISKVNLLPENSFILSDVFYYGISIGLVLSLEIYYIYYAKQKYKARNIDLEQKNYDIWLEERKAYYSNLLVKSSSIPIFSLALTFNISSSLQPNKSMI